MDNKEFSKQLEIRTRKFAVTVIKFSMLLPIITETKVIKNQITKSGSSIGANYREANRSRSKADFKNKITICEGEASETLFWLEVIDDLQLVDAQQLKLITKEATELLAIFTSIGNNLKP